jgi:transposase-like protein
MSNLEQQLSALRQSATQFRPRGRHPRFPQSFRDQVIDLVRQLRSDGWSAERVARALGISPPTVRAWLYQDERNDLGASEQTPTFLPVTLNNERPLRAHPTHPLRTFTLHARAGWTVEGLTLDDLDRLLHGGHS